MTVVVKLYLCARNCATNHNCYCIMTKEEFEVLQLDLQQSGKSVKDYLQEAGVNYSTYNYWRKKLLSRDTPKPELAPISFTPHADPVLSFKSVPTMCLQL